MRLSGFANVGGYLANVGPLMGSMGVTRNLAAIYRTPLIEVATKVAFTNTSPVGAYRGAGRPEANYFMERLIDTAAREMGIDSVEMRRRNHIKPGGDALQDRVGHDLRQRRVHRRFWTRR